MKKMLIFTLSILLICIPTNSSANQAEEICPIYDFSTLFYEDYFPGTKWANKEISWSTESFEINGKSISRKVSNLELEWIRQGIKSWDDALETVSFKEISDYQNAEINIGITELSSNFTAYWSAWWQGNIRYKSYIEINSLDINIKSKDIFIHTIQHEVGNVLGLGDIKVSNEINSVFEDPFQPPFGNKVLGDFDITLIRQLYGESTCSSTFLFKKINNDTPINQKKYIITCIKQNKKIKLYKYNKNYLCPKGYNKQKVVGM
jgi:hypothetical protein